MKAWLQLTGSRGSRTEKGAALVEYALLLALIVIVCLVAMQYFGNSTSASLSNTGSHVGAASH